ncbi:aldose epimerase family protein [Robiginitomaculum antarcticum]|uniref:aldose epimerase family protein n=1 Tax=Robiginitomaculum antarcticum TaxID=437507 RepID=UPI0003759A5D|nr:aldose epimerase family protein [Robiginitomaculum antarcticum]
MSISQRHFGHMPDGRAVSLYSLVSTAGLTASITPYGARTSSIQTPDNTGALGENVLGYDSLEPYLSDPYFLGATLGRYANRIGAAVFELSGVPHRLTRNDGANHLHGGSGFHTKLWTAEVDRDALVLRYVSPEGEDGYPGNLSAQLRIYWDNERDLRLDYSAQTDAPCPVNLSNHTYFNLGYSPDIKDHSAQILAGYYLPTDTQGIPTGAIDPVEKTPLDLRSSAIIGHRFNACALPTGFDHSYVINGEGLRTAAIVRAPETGRRVALLTTQPGLQFYTGAHLKGSIGRDGKARPAFAGLCLEGQHHPDSPHHSLFPNTVLQPAETYQQTQIYQFDTL